MPSARISTRWTNLLTLQAFRAHAPKVLGAVSLTTALALVFTLGAPVPARAATDGLALATKVHAADAGWHGESATAIMQLRRSDGKMVERHIRTRALEVPGDGDRTVIEFDSPSDVRGTILLSHAHPVGRDDQWLFLPALKRTKRIGSGNRAGPFMASEFTFEDLASEALERYRYELLGGAECGEPNQTCLHYARFPVDKNSGYSRQVVFVDTEHYRIHKIDYYDRRNVLLKTLLLSGYEPFDTFWRARQWNMYNHQTGKATLITWTKRTLQAEYKLADFHKSAIMR